MITIDGVSIAEISLASLRDQIAIVNQDVVLFNDTIANNIAYAQDINSNDKTESICESLISSDGETIPLFLQLIGPC